MRVVALLDRWRHGSGGLESYLEAVLPRLAETHEVWLAARDAGRAPPAGVRARGAAATALVPRPWRDRLDASALQRAVRELRPEVVWSLRAVPCPGALWQPHAGSAPHLRRARGRARPGLRARVLESLEVRTLRQAARVLCMSPRVERQIAERRPDVPRVVLPPPLPDAAWPALPPAARMAARRFLWCGRDARLKGAVAARGWFRAWRAQRPDAALRMWSRSERHLERVLQASRATLSSEGITLRGWDGSFAAALGEADALLHPTLSDACSLVCLEAAAHGLAVVTTSANGLAELLGAPFLVTADPQVPESGTEALRSLLAQREDGGEAAWRAAWKDVRARFSLGRHLEGLQEEMGRAANAGEVQP